MRIDVQGYSFDKETSKKNPEVVDVQTAQLDTQKQTSQIEEQDYSKEKLNQAVNSINEFFEINQNELKFVFHEGLEKYYVQLINSKTEEVVREIPSKKLLDIFYEMQKIVGMIVDEKI